MKLHLGISLLLLLFANAAVAAPYPEVKVQKINDRVYAMLGPFDAPNKKNRGYVNNVLVVLGNRGTILVDAGSHPSVSEHIKKAIRKVAPKPVTHVLVTHHHGDHHLGVAAFPGVQVVASEYCAQQIQEYGHDMVVRMENMTGLKLPGLQATVPHMRIPPKSRRSMTIDGVSLELITPETAHTPGDMLVYLPDDEVLAAGDVLVHGVNPNIGDGNLKKWLGVLDNIRKIPAKTIMPGHGPLMQPPDVVEFRALMGDFYRTIEMTYKAGGDMSDVRKKLDLRRWQKLSRYEEMMGGNISKVWLEVEADNF